MTYFEKFRIWMVEDSDWIDQLILVIIFVLMMLWLIKGI